MNRPINSNFFAQIIILFFIGCLSNCQSTASKSIQRDMIDREIAAIVLPEANAKYISEFNIAFAKLVNISGTDKYQLSVSIDFSTENLLISQNTDLINEGIKARVTYKLQAFDYTISNPHQTMVEKMSFSLNTLTQQTFTLRSAHNVTDLPYAIYVESNQLKNNLAIMAAEEIYKRLFIYFHHDFNKKQKLAM